MSYYAHESKQWVKIVYKDDIIITAALGHLIGFISSFFLFLKVSNFWNSRKNIKLARKVQKTSVSFHRSTFACGLNIL